jgi:hypothetical protein
VYRCPIARHERYPFWGRAPVSVFRPLGGTQLKTLFVGLCLLIVVTQAAAAANGESTAKAGTATPGRDTAPAMKRGDSLESRLQRKLVATRKHRSTVRFFMQHRWLLSSSEHHASAQLALRRATRRPARVWRNVAAIRRVLARREARSSNAPPKAAICDVFGRRYCRQALSVSWCESRHATTARNGPYLGLFQMGWSERQLYGHGSTARQQARAAHRYFVVSGRDWSPWSCKPVEPA